MIPGSTPGKADIYYTDWEPMPYPFQEQLPFILLDITFCINLVKDELAVCTEKLKTAEKLQQQY